MREPVTILNAMTTLELHHMEYPEHAMLALL